MIGNLHAPSDHPTSVYCILGNPVAQSLSPLMHTTAFQHLGMNAVYVPFEVDDLTAALTGLKGLKIKGASVTHPFKEAVMAHIDAVDEIAEGVGAVNTLLISGNRIEGTNTDWLGIIRTIETVLPVKGHRFAVLGAGGAARAALFGIRKQGGQASVINRSEHKGRALAEAFHVPFHPLSRLEIVEADCLVNTTPVGMYPNVDDTPVDRSALRRFGAVVDAVYNPLETRLLKEARSSGCKTASGLEMFVHQGIEQFRRWTGIDPPAELMRASVYRELTGKGSSPHG